jgi:hypothetical protein
LGKCDILHRAEVVETEVAELRRKFSQGWSYRSRSCKLPENMTVTVSKRKFKEKWWENMDVSVNFYQTSKFFDYK